MATTFTAEEIKKVIAEIAHLQSVKNHFNSLNETLKSITQELSEKEFQLNVEQNEIEALEKISIASLFHKVLGNKEEQLEKEKREYLALAMKIKELKKSYELSQFELSIVEKKVKTESELNQKLSKLKEQRANEIINYNEESKSELVKIYTDLDSTLKFLNELQEAYTSGKRTIESTGKTLGHLQEAIKMGQHDMMGSRYADYQKRSHLDRASESASYAQLMLKSYNKELADIGISDKYLYLNVEAYDTFTDTFFDNLITDWILQNKIKNTYNIVDALHDKITVIQESIKSSVANHESKIDSLKKRVDEILL